MIQYGYVHLIFKILLYFFLLYFKSTLYFQKSSLYFCINLFEYHVNFKVLHILSVNFCIYGSKNSFMNYFSNQNIKRSIIKMQEAKHIFITFSLSTVNILIFFQLTFNIYNLFFMLE